VGFALPSALFWQAWHPQRDSSGEFSVEKRRNDNIRERIMFNVEMQLKKKHLPSLFYRFVTAGRSSLRLSISDLNESESITYSCCCHGC
jgi:hypothetical protein